MATIDVLNTDCPIDLKKRAETLFYNGFGHRLSGNTFVACFCRKLNNDELTKLKTLSGARSLEQDEFLGRYYLLVHWSEYNKIKSILNHMLTLGLWFRTSTKISVVINPSEFSYYDDTVYENKVIDDAKELMKKDLNLAMNYPYYSDIFPDLWNWKTERGRIFCINYRKLRGLPNDDIEINAFDDINNYYNWDYFRNYDPLTLQSTIVENKSENKQQTLTITQVNNHMTTNDDDNLCMICLNNKPETKVEPCGHSVVCNICSDKLKYTNDYDTCVRCRRKIKRIINL